MPPSSGDPRESQPLTENGQPELELEAGPRAERPNFLTATRFVDFDLPSEILEGLDNAGFEYCTPIQAQAIPVAMRGLDIAGQAQTGTGKTTAFLVPLLNRLLKNKPLEPGVPRAIIVTPTRELALQIHEDALVLAGAANLRQALVIGGIDYKEQADLLTTGPEIVICTPGRIIDYLQQGIFKTKGIEAAVVDEADRLLDMGFIKDLKFLLGKLPPFTHRQTMLFSATLDDRVLELTYEFMNPPQFITAEPDKATKVHIEQELYHVGREEKLRLLIGLLRREEHRRVIIFANTKSGVEWLAKKLTLNGFQAEGITGDLPQPKRLKLMEAFKENRLQILAATDVASRGIHVDDVSHVYNYDLPQDAENYVHRIGRTARAGHTGKAVSFGCEDYVFHLEAIENLLGEKIPVFWAEQEWFQEDQAGDVHLKDRRGGGDRDRRKGSGRGGREGGGAGGRAPRGSAKSQRPGGIFGLSPRFAGGDVPDVRQVLSWTVAPEEEPVLEGEIIEVPGEPAQAQDREERPERERRRKRRRGRRGREAAPEAGAGQAVAPESGEEAGGPEPEGPIAAADAPEEAVPAAEAGAKKAGAKKSRRSSRKPKAEPSAPMTGPAGPGASEAGEARETTSDPLPAEIAPRPSPAPAPSGDSPETPTADPVAKPAVSGRKKPAAPVKKPRGAGKKAGEMETPDQSGTGDAPGAAAEAPAPAKKASVKKKAASRPPAKAEDAEKAPAGDGQASPKAAAKPRRAPAKKADAGAGEPLGKAAVKKPAAPGAKAKKTSSAKAVPADGGSTGSERQ